MLRLYVTGGESLYELRYVAEELVKKDLESTEGVAAVKVHGGLEEEIEVRIDEGRLALLGLPIAEIESRLLRSTTSTRPAAASTSPRRATWCGLATSSSTSTTSGRP